ncbi:MAG: PD-(D/E)XK nuclease-like domain-containing protein, partial [Pseudomonadales bacterium]|nr:PD-(D/E)XK nuclease-like domain-containing protein [Pseudomonadales bacterium]
KSPARRLGSDTDANLRPFHSKRGSVEICLVVDLKTTTDLTWFENDAKRRRYINQLAFYQAVVAEATGQWLPVHLVAVEKIEPYRCGVWQISENTLNLARQENEAAIRRLKAAIASGAFPTGYEQMRLLEAS